MNTSTSKSAKADPGASPKGPPQWAESLLRHLLKPRDRGNIGGNKIRAFRGICSAVRSSPNTSIGAVNSHGGVSA